MNRDTGSYFLPSSYDKLPLSLSMSQLILMEMTLHGEESTDSSDEGISWRRNVKVFNLLKVRISII